MTQDTMAIIGALIGLFSLWTLVFYIEKGKVKRDALRPTAFLFLDLFMLAVTMLKNGSYYLSYAYVFGGFFYWITLMLGSTFRKYYRRWSLGDRRPVKEEPFLI